MTHLSVRWWAWFQPFCSDVPVSSDLVAQQRRVDLVLLVGKGVDDDVVLVRVGVVDELHHVADLLRALRVLLADVPVQRQRVTKARDEFAAVELALRPELAAVERLRHTPRDGLDRRAGRRRFRSPAV